MRVLKAVRTREKWSETETRKRAQNAIDLKELQAITDQEIGYAEFIYDVDTFKKVINIDLSLNDFHKWAIYLWMRSCYGNELKQIILEETLKQKETLLHSFNKLLGFDELNASIAGAIVGEYNLYRPLYSSPTEKILVQRLTVGSKDSVFDCVLSGEYEASPGKIVRDRFEGKIVPQGERVAAILRLPKNFRGTMIVHFDELDINAGGDEVETMGGLMMTAIGNGRSSAWPILAKRVAPDEPIAHPIVSKNQLDLLPIEAVEAMDRGAVHWSTRHYPHPFSGLR